MRLSLYVIMCFSLALAKDRNYKLHQYRDHTQITSRHGIDSQQNDGSMVSRSSRDDTSTVWLDDFEGDISGWTVGEGWALTEESSYSVTHSFNIDDDNYDVVSSIISPIVTLPELGGADAVSYTHLTLPTILLV